MKVNLLGKTELWIRDVKLDDVNLGEVAAAVASVLGLSREEVLVTDASDNHLTLDILRKEIEAERIFGKKAELLRALSNVPGINVSEKTSIHSEGILGFIDLDEEIAKQAFQKSSEMVEEIMSRIRKRCIVFPTGEEVKKGTIRDTNSPYIKSRLEAEGFCVDIGNALNDDVDEIATALNSAIDSGYGVVITTGGVGAESKDCTVEALRRVDPHAATPYVTKYKKGTGRHAKDGVRIGTGRVGESLLVTLPGPHEEVKILIEILISCIKRGESKDRIAAEIARALRERYMQNIDVASHRKHQAD
ncbi:MAG: competence/damage-inducible protein A [Methanomassiliicoccales archaeon]|nr:competence/damage-inducible protein A [Methanomassiliicoccales archaeon]